MATFKTNISNKGKTYKVETSNESLIGKKIGDVIDGKLISDDLEGYEVKITGTSDKAGFPGLPEQSGPRLRKVLLTYGKAMHRRPRREGKKKIPNPTPKGLRLRKTVRGNEISEDTIQINFKVEKEGKKKFEDFFKPAEPEQTENEPPQETTEQTQEKKE